MGDFFAGFLVGALGSATAVLLTTPRSGAGTRQDIADRLSAAQLGFTEATTGREQALWDEFRAHVQRRPNHPPRLPRR